MILDLYLLRHGESEANLSNIVGGRIIGTPLSDRGRIQARALGERLIDEEITFDEVYVSPALRTTQTAEIVLGELERAVIPGPRLVIVDELLELSQGELEGQSRDLIYTDKRRALMNANPFDYKAPGGESQREVEERAYGWIEKTLLDRNEDLRIAIFGHGMVTKCLIRKFLDSNPANTYKMNIDNCSITRFKHDKKGWSMIQINDHSHLRYTGFVPNRR